MIVKGDKIRISAELLQFIHEMPKAITETVIVKDIKTLEDGTKVIVVGMPPLDLRA